MTANRELGAIRGIPEETLKEIDEIHKEVERVTLIGLCNEGIDAWMEVTLTELDFKLQEKWGYPANASFHTLFKSYRMKKLWAGRTFRCTETGNELTIPDCVSERDFFVVGKGYVDVGVLGGYCRFGGKLEEVN